VSNVPPTPYGGEGDARPVSLIGARISPAEPTPAGQAGQPRADDGGDGSSAAGRSGRRKHRRRAGAPARSPQDSAHDQDEAFHLEDGADPDPAAAAAAAADGVDTTGDHAPTTRETLPWTASSAPTAGAPTGSAATGSAAARDAAAAGRLTTTVPADAGGPTSLAAPAGAAAPTVPASQDRWLPTVSVGGPGGTSPADRPPAGRGAPGRLQGGGAPGIGGPVDARPADARPAAVGTGPIPTSAAIPATTPPVTARGEAIPAAPRAVAPPAATGLAGPADPASASPPWSAPNRATQGPAGASPWAAGPGGGGTTEGGTTEGDGPSGRWRRGSGGQEAPPASRSRRSAGRPSASPAPAHHAPDHQATAAGPGATAGAEPTTGASATQAPAPAPAPARPRRPGRPAAAPPRSRDVAAAPGVPAPRAALPAGPAAGAAEPGAELAVRPPLPRAAAGGGPGTSEEAVLSPWRDHVEEVDDLAPWEEIPLRESLSDRAAAELPGSWRVAVTSAFPYSGTTTLVGILGLVLAGVRGESTLAVDLTPPTWPDEDPDEPRGDAVAPRIGAPGDVVVSDVLRHRTGASAEVRMMIGSSRAGGEVDLDVIALRRGAGDDAAPGTTGALAHADDPVTPGMLRSALSLLTRAYPLILIDAPTAAPLTPTATRAADLVVVVTLAAPTDLDGTAAALRDPATPLLPVDDAGRRPPVLVAVVSPRRGRWSPRTRSAAARLGRQVDGMIRIPYESRLDPSRHTAVRIPRLRARTRRAYLHVAAEVVETLVRLATEETAIAHATADAPPDDATRADTPDQLRTPGVSFGDLRSDGAHTRAGGPDRPGGTTPAGKDQR
jgi:hypothetical protein